MKLLFFTILSLLPYTIAIADSTEGGITVPDEVKPFIEANAKPIAISASDLNGDGHSDYLLVLERQDTKYSDSNSQRPLLILLKQSDNSLKLTKKNEKIIYCSRCGGAMGDPFAGISTDKTNFSVEHYGGSGWRWSVAYRFNYSKRDKTWQLVRVEHESFHVADPDKVETTLETPPKDYGKIDIADFDPEHYLGRGPK